MKMFKEDKEAWLDALRSGEYEQGRYALHNTSDGSYCCLGVLQSCLMDGKIEGCVGSTGNSFGAIPSGSFYNLFGITGAYDRVYKDGAGANYEGQLMTFNDAHNGKRKTFKQIANWIEKNVKTHKRPRSAESQAKLDAVLESL